MKNTLAIILLLGATAAAQSASPAVTREIESLFSTLSMSSCQFSRNGSWHDAAQATSHLRRKYDYLVNQGAVSSTESFVEMAATRSSISGRPYRVKCGGAPEVDSRSWFMERLKRQRSPASNGDSSSHRH